MSEHTENPSAENASSDPTARACADKGRAARCRRGGRRRRAGRLLFFAALFGLIGAFTLPRALAGGWGPGGWGHGCSSRTLTADEAREHMGDVADHVLDRVDATDAQRDQVEAILDEAAPQVVAFRQEGQSLRQSARASLKGGQVDRAALEDLRQDALDLADRASGAALDGFVRLAEVLSPEQRAELAAAFEERHRED